MAFLNFKNTRAERIIRLDNTIPAKGVHTTALVLFTILLILAGLWAFGPEFVSKDRLLGAALLTLALAYVFWVYSLFFYSSLTKFPPIAQEEQNFAYALDFDAAEIVRDHVRRGHGDLAHLLKDAIKFKGVQFILYRVGVPPANFVQELEDYLSSQPSTDGDEQVLALLQDALQEAESATGARLVSWRELLVSLSVHSRFFKSFLFERKLDVNDIRRLVSWERSLDRDIKTRKQFWSKDNLLSHRGIGKDWASGFTVTLDEYATDVTSIISGFNARLYGRTQETQMIERILSRAGENNCVVVGDPGVGKKTIVYALAKNIQEGKTLPALAHKRVLELDLQAVLAGASAAGEIESRLKKILNEAVGAGNVILLIDDIHTLFDPKPSTGTIDATALITPYLGSSMLQIIGLCTYEGYHETIGSNPSLEKSFEKVEIRESSKEDVFSIIQDVVPRIEAHNQVLMTYQALKKAVELTDRYIKEIPFPEKAIDVLQEAAVYAQSKRRSSMVMPEDIEEVVHQKTEIPVGQIALAEKQVLLDLEKVLHRRVIGQEEAISAVANSLRRARSGITSEKKPIGSFLFLGPTGVGKTETARALASVYFGSEKHMLRFDMSEYQQPDSIDRLIGGGEESAGQLTMAVLENPFSLVLLDEIEKAHPQILNLFLQVLDDGRLTEASGRTVDFTNTIIIATSNAGAELIRQSVEQFRMENLKERLLHELQSKAIFKPEFLNRFDAVIIFKPLSQEQTEAVTELLLADLNRRLQGQDLKVAVTPGLVKKIAELGYDPEYGARPLKRVIQDRIENLVAKKVLAGEVSRGEVITIHPEELV